MALETLTFLYWHWWLVAVLLFIIEVIVPGTFFLWMAMSALAVGALSFLLPEIGTSTEIILFSILSVVSVIAWRLYQQKNPSTTAQPTLNRGGEQYIGRLITLTHPIINGFGREKIGSTLWTLQGPDAEIGMKVKIIGMDSAIVLVERL